MKIMHFGWMLIIIHLLSPIICLAKESSEKVAPVWIKNPPLPTNESYYFKVVETDAGGDLSTARKHSQKELVRNIEREFSIQITDKLESQSTTYYNEANTTFTGKDIYTLQIESADNVCIYYEKVDEYYRIEYMGGHRIFRLYVLYAVAKPHVSNPQFDNFIKTDKYGVHGLWRSAIVPGWGQFYKGSKLKGGVMLGSTAAAVGVAIYADNKKTNYMRNMAESYGSDTKRFYADKADNMKTVRNISIGAAVVMYTYSLIDAVVASGAKRVIVTKRNGRNTSLTLVPLATQEMNGVSLVCKF